MFFLKKIQIIFYTFFSIILFILSLNLRSPLFFKLRYYDLVFVLLGTLFFIIIILYNKSKNYLNSGVFFLNIIFLLSALFVGIYTEIKFQYVKYMVLNTDDRRLQLYGDHFIVGYDDINELRKLSKKGAVSGVFITAKNVKNHKVKDIKDIINSLQVQRKEQGLSELFVATDQEGGKVSRLSPPFKYMPTLSDVYRRSSSNERIKKYASEKALLLKNAGVNINFSPVVDLKIKHPVNMMNIHTLIWERAISCDPEVVSRVALEYCKELNKKRVMPVLKHFPGLGRIAEDTHFFTAGLDNSVDELLDHDWLPYKNISSQARFFIMLGHIKLNRVDAKFPVSYSKKTVKNIIRKKLNFKGVLITDDFSMGPIFYAWEPMSEIAVKAINAGVDQILISYDYDLYYYIMYDLIYQKVGDRIDKKMLKRSSERIRRVRNFIFAK